MRILQDKWKNNSDEQEYINNRIDWIDIIKVFACLLVVLGHLFQSLVLGNIISDTTVYRVFNSVIYYFHNPLLFLCSGYLYQMHGNDNSVKNHFSNCKRKVYSLIVPYIFFVSVTWCLKRMMADYVNIKVGTYWDSLFSASVAPYWFLAALMLMYILIPVFRKDQKQYLIFYLIVVVVIERFFAGYIGWAPFVYFLEFAPFFIVGMLLNNMKKIKPVVMIIAGCTFLLIFVATFANNWFFKRSITRLEFNILAFVGCIGILLLVICYSEINNSTIWNKLSEYTFPIFMMHTLAAAPVRIVLVRLRIYQASVHIICGLIASILIPIGVYSIMKYLKWPLLVMYPQKLKVRK